MKFLLLGFCLLSSQAFADENWQVIKSEHFLVYYFGESSFAQEVSGAAERYYRSITSDLGYDRFDGFWQWDNRAKIFIYNTADDFKKTARLGTEWAGGIANYGSKEIISYRWSAGFIESLLPHEIAHLIFREFVGPSGAVPRWLDEGVAQFEEPHKKEEAAKIVTEMIQTKTTIPLARLNQIDVRSEGSSDSARQYYAQSLSLVSYLIERYGGQRLTQLCRDLRDGKNLDMALHSAYSGQIRNLADLEDQWLAYCVNG